MALSKHRYAEMTWPEIRQVAAEDRVVVIPIGTIEDHGPHLPVDCDVRIIEAICARACAQAPETTVLLPTVSYGYSPHHGDFPGSLNIRWNVFVEYLSTSPATSSGTGSGASSSPMATAPTCRWSTSRRA